MTPSYTNVGAALLLVPVAERHVSTKLLKDEGYGRQWRKALDGPAACT